MALVLLDSSVWISFFTLDDVHHKEAESIRKDNFDQKNLILLPDLIYAEVLNPVRYLPHLKFNSRRHTYLTG